MLLTVVLVLFGATQLLATILGAAAQNTNTTCIPSYEWVCTEMNPCIYYHLITDYRPITLVDKVLVWLHPICKESVQKEVSSNFLSRIKHVN
jgi:hypothetical protein